MDTKSVQNEARKGEVHEVSQVVEAEGSGLDGHEIAGVQADDLAGDASATDGPACVEHQRLTAHAGDADTPAPALKEAPGGEGVAQSTPHGPLSMDSEPADFGLKGVKAKKKSKGPRPAKPAPDAAVCDSGAPCAAHGGESPLVAMEDENAAQRVEPAALPEVDDFAAAIEALPPVEPATVPGSTIVLHAVGAVETVTVWKLTSNARVVRAKVNPLDASEAPRNVLVRRPGRTRVGMKLRVRLESDPSWVAQCWREIA